jgi:hypothetical protein
MRLVGHIARMINMKINTIFWLENLKGRDFAEELVVDGKIILKWILGK